VRFAAVASRFVAVLRRFIEALLRLLAISLPFAARRSDWFDWAPCGRCRRAMFGAAPAISSGATGFPHAQLFGFPSHVARIALAAGAPRRHRHQ